MITCALDLELGEIRYYQNGEDLGVAFTKVDTTKAWYPVSANSNNEKQKLTRMYVGGFPFNWARLRIPIWRPHGSFTVKEIGRRNGKYTNKSLAH